MRRFIDIVVAGAETLAGVSVLLLAAILGLEIALRAVGEPIAGTTELGSLLLVIVIYFALAGTQSVHGHVAMDAVVVRMGPAARRVCFRITLAICLTIGLVLTYTTAKDMLDSYEIGEFQRGTLPYPLWPAKLAVTFGIFLYCVVAASQLFSRQLDDDGSAAAELQ